MLVIRPSHRMRYVGLLSYLLYDHVMPVYFVGTGLLIGHVLLLGQLISFVPSAHPTIPLMGRYNIILSRLYFQWGTWWSYRIWTGDI